MKTLIACCLMLALVGCKTLPVSQSKTLSQSYRLSAKVKQNAHEPFISHRGDGPFSNYLAMNIVYAPLKALYQQVNQTVGGVLINRGEAHITVITPPEFDQILSQRINIEQIEAIAKAHQIQTASFDVVCLGAAQKTINGELAQSYFVVVDAPQLVEIRAQIRDLYVNAGGHYQDFIPQQYYPHITVGFQPRDLHLSDGVVKDRSSCSAQLH